MDTLLCLGFGYCAAHYANAFGSRFARIVGTSRAPRPGAPVEMMAFDGASSSPALRDAISAATHLLVSTPPDARGDPALAMLTREIESAAGLRAIVYLSSLGVYGDHGGAWIDEGAATVPAHSRGAARLAAEGAWQALGTRRNTPVAVLRLAGIYGPGQNTFLRLREGRAHRIAKPGHVFNRIHVDDIAQTIDAAFDRHAGGVFNVCDDEPAPGGDLVVMAAALLGVDPPPELSWDAAQRTLSPMALSFYATCNRVSNLRIKRELGIVLRHPTYREGLRALLEAGLGDPREAS